MTNQHEQRTRGISFDQALTLRQVATHLGVSVPTVQRLIARGDLPHQRVSPRRCVIRLSALENYLDRVSSQKDPSDANSTANS
jgi:excisionase family DNA binding protein